VGEDGGADEFDGFAGEDEVAPNQQVHEVGELERFARMLREDVAAVQAGPTLRHRNGQTEGQVNRLKLVKRQASGRAQFDLLRKRVLRAS
jgi:transposase